MIKILTSNRTSIAFNTESLNFYPLPAGFSDDSSKDEIPALGMPPVVPRGNPSNDDQPKIGGLVLLVAQKCNLKCSYCFAKAYMNLPSDKQIMSPVTAWLAVEKVLRNAPETFWVQFFGGEPLIGFAAIKAAVKAAEKHCLAHQTQKPAFTITTNGTLIDQGVVDFFKANDFSVTVSLDGPRHVNDKQRRFPSGSGTYDIIRKNIDLVRNAGVEVRIEAVFTDNHTRCNETIESTYDFLSNCIAGDICLKPAIGVFQDKCLDKDFLANLEQSYTASTERIMDSWLTDSPMRLTYWLDILDTLISRKGKTHFCGAGFRTITVDYSGKVFPCHTLMSDSFCMGNVHDKDFPGEDFRRVTALMRQSSKDSFSKCVKCWAKKLCSPCYGDTSFASRTLSAPRESLCVIIRSVARATLLKLAEFMTDGEKWKRFVESVNRTPIRSGFDCKEKTP